MHLSWGPVLRIKTKFCVNENCYLIKGKELLGLLKANYKLSYYSWYSSKLTDQKTKTQTDIFRMTHFFSTPLEKSRWFLEFSGAKKLIYAFKSSYKDSQYWLSFYCFIKLPIQIFFFPIYQIQMYPLILENQIMTLSCKLFILVVYAPHTA